MWVLFLVTLCVLSASVVTANNNECVATSGSGQFILVAGSHNFLSSDFGKSFVQIPDFYPATEYWHGCSVDESGQHMALGSSTSGLWISHNFGATWASSGADIHDAWLSIATSSAGDRMVATNCFDSSSGHGQMVFSSDFGRTWAVKTAPQYLMFNKVVSDSTGKYLAAIAQSSKTGITTGMLSLSDDFGGSWLAVAVPYDTFLSIATDATGKLLTIAGSKANYVSKDRGAFWETVPKIYPDLWYVNFFRVSASATGQNVLALTNTREIFVSSDFGHTWGIAYNRNESWRYGANSADFKVLVAVTSDDVAVSRDAGETWDFIPLKV